MELEKFFEEMGRRSVEGLPEVAIGGERLYLRGLDSLEFGNITAECMMFAESVTDETMRGKPCDPWRANAIALQAASNMVNQSPKDMYEQSLSYVSLTVIEPMSVAFRLLKSDGEDFLPTASERAKFVSMWLRNSEKMRETFKGVLENKGRDPKNSPTREA